MRHADFGTFFEDFEVEQIIRHPLTKTIFESDNNLFSMMTLNAHPVHTNLAYAEAQQHGQILVVGTLVFSLAVGITVPEISGKAIANLEYSSIRHLHPVFLNDTLNVVTEVLGKRASQSKADRGVVEVRSVAENQNGVAVLSFERKVLVKRNVV